MTILNDHLEHHKHVQKMYEELLADVPGIHVHSQPDVRCKREDVRGKMEEGRCKREDGRGKMEEVRWKR